MSIRRVIGGGSPQEAALAAALAERGVSGRVESRGPLAILITDSMGVERLVDAELRRGALALAREHGFSHLAVELGAGADDADAAPPRD